jgi:multiple sugar transport system substrate-binding protein
MSEKREELSRISRRELLVRSGQLAAGMAAGGILMDAFESTALAANAVTITVREHQKLRLDLLRSVAPQFEAQTAAKGKPIKVKIEEGQTDDSAFQTKLTVDYAAGNGPDLTSYGMSWTPDFIAARFLADDTHSVNLWKDWQTQFYPIVRKDTTLSGHVYFVPREMGVLSLYYRQDILKKFGISTAQPKTWNDLLNRAREIKRKTGKFALLFPAGTSWGGGTFDEGFIHLMLGTKSKLYNAKTKRWVVRSKGLLDVFTFYYTIAKEKLLPVQPLLAPMPWQPTKYQMFPNGDLIITTSGTWAWEFDWGPKGATPIPDIFHKVATWKFPSEDGHPFVYAGPGWVWAIASRSPQKAAAFEFVKFIMSPRVVAKGVAQIGNVSPRRDAKRYPPYSQKPYLYKTEADYATGRYFHPEPDESKIVQLVGQATVDLITLNKSPKQVQDNFASHARDLLGSNRVEVEK